VGVAVAIVWVEEEVAVESFTNIEQISWLGLHILLTLEMGVSMEWLHRVGLVMGKTQLPLGLLHLEVVVVDINTVVLLTQETMAVAVEVDRQMRVAQAQEDLWCLQVSLPHLF
jgi:hypothetical protein